MLTATEQWFIARLNFMLLFCVHSSKFGKCLLIKDCMPTWDLLNIAI